MSAPSALKNRAPKTTVVVYLADGTRYYENDSGAFVLGGPGPLKFSHERIAAARAAITKGEATKTEVREPGTPGTDAWGRARTHERPLPEWEAEK